MWFRCSVSSAVDDVNVQVGVLLFAVVSLADE